MSASKGLAWAAGLFEGEGYVGSVRWSKDGRTRARMSLNMTDEETVCDFHEVIGCGFVNGPYWRKNSTKPFWQWNLNRLPDIKQVAEQLAPWLNQRRLVAFASAIANDCRLEAS